MPEQHKSFTYIIEPFLSVIDLTLDMGVYSEGFPIPKDQPTYWVARISVHKNHRNKGIGTKLMNDLINWLDENKYASVIGVSSYGEMTNQQLQKFYEKFGFIFNEHLIGYRLPKEQNND